MSSTSILSLPEARVLVTSCWTRRARWPGCLRCGLLDAGAAGGDYETPAAQSGSSLRHWSSARRFLSTLAGATAHEFPRPWRALAGGAAQPTNAAPISARSRLRHKLQTPHRHPVSARLAPPDRRSCRGSHLTRSSSSDALSKNISARPGSGLAHGGRSGGGGSPTQHRGCWLATGVWPDHHQHAWYFGSHVFPRAARRSGGRIWTAQGGLGWRVVWLPDLTSPPGGFFFF